MSHTAEWKVRLYLFEERGRTKARAELDTGTRKLTGRGAARCRPQDREVPEIGDELAADRAFADLAAQLARAAYGDMEAHRARSSGQLRLI
ncbi:dsRBD fold-containing protein [Streptomyces sp. NPDC006691]|uniref:dsRBD fold-containing protein n=1 Tax=Streptomyces sp. NPDC006691 TaxID=3364757 RepID=UPI0036796760